jgi:hypothetical protein
VLTETRRKRSRTFEVVHRAAPLDGSHPVRGEWARTGSALLSTWRRGPSWTKPRRFSTHRTKSELPSPSTRSQSSRRSVPPYGASTPWASATFLGRLTPLSEAVLRPETPRFSAQNSLEVLGHLELPRSSDCHFVSPSPCRKQPSVRRAVLCRSDWFLRQRAQARLARDGQAVIVGILDTILRSPAVKGLRCWPEWQREEAGSRSYPAGLLHAPKRFLTLCFKREHQHRS